MVALLLKKPSTLMYTQHKLAVYLFMAKKKIAKAWRTPTLKVHEVVMIMQTFLVNDKISAMIQDKMKTFERFWNPCVQNFLPQRFDDQLIHMSTC